MLHFIKRLIPKGIKNQVKLLCGGSQSQSTPQKSPPEPRTKYSSYAGKLIREEQEGNDLIKQWLHRDKPMMVARIGSVEQSCIYNYIQLKEGKVSDWNGTVVNSMANNAGFFPNSPEMLARFSEEFLTHLKYVDVLGVWFMKGEKYICENICSQAEFIRLTCIEPYYHENPWSELLEGKKVLVIHPFSRSIEQQYKKRKLLFADEKVLPEFDLQIIQAVQSRGRNPVNFQDWFEALDSMQVDMSQRNFDIALIGAGAYGLPLASFAKSLGKQVIHLGGATQILFGIKGKRWDDKRVGQEFYNQFWERPLPEEAAGSQATGYTGQCYW